MKKFAPVLLSSLLMLGAAACSDVEKTASNAPSTPTPVKAPSGETAQTNKSDATSEVRRNQLNSDIRAREQRNNAGTAVGADPLKRADSDLASEVRSKLEANLPASSLTIEAKDGIVKVGGVVPTQEQLARIEPLSKEIKGVKGVEVKVNVQPAKP